MKTEVARSRLTERPGEADQMLSELAADTRRAIDEVRRLTYDLRPPVLDQLGLAAALREQAASFVGNPGHPLEVADRDGRRTSSAQRGRGGGRLSDWARGSDQRGAPQRRPPRDHPPLGDRMASSCWTSPMTATSWGPRARRHRTAVDARACGGAGRVGRDRPCPGRGHSGCTSRIPLRGTARCLNAFGCLSLTTTRSTATGCARCLDRSPWIEIVGEAIDGDEAVRGRTISSRMSCSWISACPSSTGSRPPGRSRLRIPAIGVLVLTMFEDDDSAFRGMCAGARGYLLKDAGREELALAIEAIGHGDAIFGSGVARRVQSYFAAAGERRIVPFPGLTGREREVLDRIARGEDNTRIASRLGISPKTVRNHVSTILDKLMVVDRSQAIVRAREAGLGTDPLPPGYTGASAPRP